MVRPVTVTYSVSHLDTPGTVVDVSLGAVEGRRRRDCGGSVSLLPPLSPLQSIRRLGSLPLPPSPHGDLFCSCYVSFRREGSTTRIPLFVEQEDSRVDFRYLRLTSLMCRSLSCSILQVPGVPVFKIPVSLGIVSVTRGRALEPNLCVGKTDLCRRVR